MTQLKIRVRAASLAVMGTLLCSAALPEPAQQSCRSGRASAGAQTAAASYFREIEKMYGLYEEGFAIKLRRGDLTQADVDRFRKARAAAGSLTFDYSDLYLICTKMALAAEADRIGLCVYQKTC